MESAPVTFGRQVWRSVKKFWEPTTWNKQKLNRLSWGVSFILLAKWFWDDEQQNPKFFQEVPTILGLPQARELAQDDAEKWNAAIAPKEQQLAPWQNTGIARHHSMS
eukprot:symbB.v1.2.026111.t1/scaffold2585.1/size75681/3